MIEKKVSLNGQDMHGLEAGADIIKTIRMKDSENIRLTISPNGLWGTEKP